MDSLVKSEGRRVKSFPRLCRRILSSLFPLLSSLCDFSTRRRGRNHMKKSSLSPGSMDSAPTGNEEISSGLSASSYIVGDNG